MENINNTFFMAICTLEIIFSYLCVQRD